MMKRTVTISESHWMSVDCSDGEQTSQRGELWRSSVEVCIETESLLTLATIVQPLFFFYPACREDLL